MRTLIKGGKVLLGKNEFSIVPRDIVVGQDLIIKLEEKSESEEFEQVIHANGCLIIPGFINAHIHSHDHFNKGQFDNVPLEVWMPLLRPYSSGIGASKEEIYLRTLWGCIELLKTGTTTVIDDVVQTPFNDEEKLEAIFQAYKDAGLRAYITTHVGNKPIQETIPYLQSVFKENNFLPSQQNILPEVDIIDFVDCMLQKYNKNDSIQRYAVAPSGPQRCTPKLLNGLVELAKKFKVPAICHVLETYMQKVSGEYFFDKSLVSYMDDIGALNEYVSLVHCVWVSRKDIELIKKHNANVIHNPSSNLKLGSGIAPIRQIIDEGINVSLGTDNTSSNDALNMFNEMRLAGLLHKITNSEPRKWLGASEALSMATLGGAVCVGQEKNIGSIEVGKKADLVILSIENERFIPNNNYINQLVFAENGSSVRDVLINGRVVVRDGRIVNFDEGDVMKKVKKMMPKIRAEQELARKEGEPLRTYLEAAYHRANASKKECRGGCVQ